MRIVAIDGPAGAGKSTVARAVARRLGFRFLDTGAMYRAHTLLALRIGLPNDDCVGAGAIAEAMTLIFEPGGVLLANGSDVTEEIRSSEVTLNVSAFSAMPEVRRAISREQRLIGAAGDLVCEGRDMGSVVFPEAQVKIFLDASVDVRAERRHTELKTKGSDVSFDDIRSDIERRDALDSGRETAPLVCTDGHIRVDTSKMNQDQVIDHVLQIAHAALQSESAS